MFTLVVKRLFLAVTPVLLALVPSNTCQGQQPANQTLRLPNPCKVKARQAGLNLPPPEPTPPAQLLPAVENRAGSSRQAGLQLRDGQHSTAAP